MSDNVNNFQSFISTDTHFKIVHEVGARTHEKVVLQHPGIKQFIFWYTVSMETSIITLRNT